MKPLLILLLSTSLCYADDWKAQFQRGHVSLYGAGPCPDVTETNLPAFIADAVKAKQADPDAAKVIRWTTPVFSSTRYAGTRIGFWTMDVTVRTGSGSVASYGVNVKAGKVSFIKRL